MNFPMQGHWLTDIHFQPILVQYVCTLEGYNEPKKPKERDPSKPPPVPRPNAHSVRCGCPYRLNLCYHYCVACSEDCGEGCCQKSRSITHPSQWKITKFNPEHCHDMDPPILRTTTLTPAMKELIEAAASTKHCKYTTITELLEAKYKVPIDAVQVKNHISRIRAKTGCESLSTSDAHRIDRELSLKDAADANFTYFRQEDAQRRLQRIFWQTADQRELLRQYHDVVVFDTTAGTNFFKMPLHLFVVVDSFFRTRLVGCALTTQETAEDFE